MKFQIELLPVGTFIPPIDKWIAEKLLFCDVPSVDLSQRDKGKFV